jgi:hypothetical protein
MLYERKLGVVGHTPTYIMTNIVGLILLVLHKLNTQGKADEELRVLRRAKFQHEGTDDFHQWCVSIPSRLIYALLQNKTVIYMMYHVTHTC